MRICVTGFFHRDNWGDDLFEHFYRTILPKISPESSIIDYVTTDGLRGINNTYDLIIVAGGDVLNWYFTSKLQDFNPNGKVPMIALSVGVPYLDDVHDGMFDDYHLIGSRFKTDLEVLKMRYHKDKLLYTPDLCLYLPELYHDIEKPEDTPDTFRVGVCLSRPIFRNNKGYPFLVKKLAQLLDHVIRSSPKVQLVLIPFNTQDHVNEGDLFINKDVEAAMEEKPTMITTKLSTLEMFKLFKTLNLTICMRFHSHVLAYTCNVPILSLTHTTKVEKFLKENNIETCVPFERNAHDVPIDINIEACKELFDNMRRPVQKNNPLPSLNDFLSIIKSVLYSPSQGRIGQGIRMNSTVEEAIHKVVSLRTSEDQVAATVKKLKQKRLSFAGLLRGISDQDLDDLVQTALETLTGIAKSPYYHGMYSKIRKLDYDPYREFKWVWNNHLSSIADHNKVISTIRSVIDILTRHHAEGNTVAGKVNDVVNNRLTLRDIASADSDGTNDFTKLSNLIACVICNELCGHPFAMYHYGLTQKVLSKHFNCYLEFRWLLNDARGRMHQGMVHRALHAAVASSGTVDKPLYNVIRPGVLMYGNVHRSGWPSVLNRMFTRHSDDAPLILDDYLDRTFVWGSDFYAHTGYIPYTKPWCGFIHHTANSTFSSHNLITLMGNPLFVSSLPTCKGLFVMSADLARTIEGMLSKMNIQLPVHVLKHPTEHQVPQFDIKKFIANKDRKVIKIGSWLRDSTAIYRLQPYMGRLYGAPRTKVRKAQLGATIHDNYHRPKDMQLIVTHNDRESKLSWNAEDQLPTKELAHTNRFLVDVLENVESSYATVEDLPHVSNAQYDTMLTENIVFIWLKTPVSAVNTVIECIVRNTPIIVNRCAAVEEYLGKDYPLLCSDLAEANMKVTDTELLYKASEYLRNMDKTEYTLDYFMHAFEKIVSNISL